MNNVKETAKRMAEHGFQVFPKYEGKLPHNFLHNRGDKRGLFDNLYYSPSTTDSSIIDDWPEQMYGQKLTGYGVHPFRRAIVLDIDVKNGKQGKKSFQNLVERYNLDTDTLVVESPSGGRHYYFAYPDYLLEDEMAYVSSPVEIKIPNGEAFDVYEGIDVRADSAHVGGPFIEPMYEQDSSGQLLPIKDTQYKIISGVATNLSKLPADLVKYWIKRRNTDLIKVQADAIPEGIRNDYVFKQIICRYKAKNLPLWQAHAAIKELYPKLAQGKEGISLDLFLQRCTEIYEDDSYSSNNYQVILDEYLQNLVYIAGTGEIYDIRTGFSMAKANSDLVYQRFVNIEDSESGKIKAVDVYKVWQKAPEKMIVMAKVFYPGKEQIVTTSELTGQPVNVLNTYVSPKQIYNQYLNDASFSSQDFNNHPYVKNFMDVTKYVCEDKADYFLQYAAHLAQFPEKKVHHMLMITSETQGVGKDTWFKCVSAAIGQRNTKVIELSGFEDKFNSHLFEASLILINEGDTRYSRERASVYNKLKVHITTDKLERRGMRQDYITQRIFSNFIWFANNVDSIGMDEGDSRIYPHINKNDNRLPKDLAQRIYENMAQPDFGAVLYSFLSKYPIETFQYFERAPVTDDKRTLIYENMDAPKQMAMTCVLNQHEFFRFGVLNSDLLRIWFCKRFIIRNPRAVEHMVSTTIRLLIKEFGLVSKRVRIPSFGIDYGNSMFRILSPAKSSQIWCLKEVAPKIDGGKDATRLLQKSLREILPMEASIIDSEMSKYSNEVVAIDKKQNKLNDLLQ